MAPYNQESEFHWNGELHEASLFYPGKVETLKSRSYSLVEAKLVC